VVKSFWYFWTKLWEKLSGATNAGGREISLGISVPIRWTGYKMRYFSDEEIAGLDKELVCKLEQARHLAQTPFTITSGKRDPEANSEAGGVPDSSHIKGLAADLAIDGSVNRFRIVKALFDSGFRRIGIYSAHCHVDIDTEKVTDVCWTGISH